MDEHKNTEIEQFLEWIRKHGRPVSVDPANWVYASDLLEVKQNLLPAHWFEEESGNPDETDVVS